MLQSLRLIVVITIAKISFFCLHILQIIVLEEAVNIIGEVNLARNKQVKSVIMCRGEEYGIF